MSDAPGDPAAWTAPGAGTPAGEPGSWQPPSYPPSYPPAYPPAYPPDGGAGGYGPPPPVQGWAPAWVPMPGVVPLRPLGVGELLDGGVKIIRRYPKPSLALSAAVSLAVTVITIAFVLLLDSRISLTDSSSEEGFSSSFDGAGLPGQVLEFLGGAVLTGALVTVVSRAVLGQSATLRDAWEATRPRLWALLGVSLLRGLLALLPVAVVVVAVVLAGPVALLLGLLLVPYEVWLFTVLSVAPAALILERTGVRAALRRSRVLVMRDFWRMLGILLLAGLLTSVLSSILVIPVVLAFELPVLTGDATELGPTYFVVAALAGGLAQTLVAPYTAGLRALLYVDLRMRSEGLDVALQAAAA